MPASWRNPIVPTNIVFMRGDPFDYWTGIVTGLARMGTVSSGGKAVTLAGMTAGAWFGEGSMLKSELRRYDVVALRDTRLALMDRSTFFWLFENSVAFNRFLVRQLNERVGQFIGALEHGRTLDATSRVARSIASLFNPDSLSGPDASSGDHPGRNWRPVRPVPAECQPVPEAAGEGGPAATGIWRGDHRRPRKAAPLRRVRPASTSSKLKGHHIADRSRCCVRVRYGTVLKIAMASGIDTVPYQGT